MVSFLLLFCPSSYGLSKSSQNKMDLSKIIGIIFDAALVIWASALLASWTLWIGLRAIVSYGTCILFSISSFSVQKKKKLENWSRVACIPDQDSVAASNQNQLWKPPWLEPNNFGRNKKKRTLIQNQQRIERRRKINGIPGATVLESYGSFWTNEFRGIFIGISLDNYHRLFVLHL